VQELVGKVIRAEGIIQPKHPKNPSPLTPAMSITVDSGDLVRFASAEEVPKQAAMPADSNSEVKRKHIAERVDISDKILDSALNLVEAKYIENWQQSLKDCMTIYPLWENRWRYQRSQGTKKSENTFARYVAREEWASRRKDPEWDKKQPKDFHCGHTFLWNLRRGSPPHSKAKFYAMAAFEANHNVNPIDDMSATNLSAMYVVYEGANSKQSLYWYNKSGQRRAKVAGKVGKPTISKDRKFTVYDYGDTPEPYVPPIPKLPENRAVRVKMEKINPGMLREIEISPFGRWHLAKTEIDFMSNPQARKVLVDDVNAVMQSKPLVLECVYQSEKFRRVYFYRFWYKTRPPAADPQRLSAKWRDHPLLFIRSPLDRCPKQRDGAKKHL
jgi:hypothetical protein